LAYLGSGVLL